MRRCPNHPHIWPATDSMTSVRYCPECGTRDLVPDAMDVVVAARMAYMTDYGEEPEDVRLGVDRMEEVKQIAVLEHGWDRNALTDDFTLFGMRCRIDPSLQPDAVLVGRYIGGTWDLHLRRRV